VEETEGMNERNNFAKVFKNLVEYRDLLEKYHIKNSIVYENTIVM